MVEFYGVKNKVGWHAQPVGPWPSLWLEFLHNGRLQRTGNADYNTNFGGAGDLDKTFTELVARTSRPEIWWQSLR